jgi:hypothetical protein
MSIEIDDRFIDVDFSKQPEFVPGDLGLGDSATFCGYFEDSEEIYDDARIDREIELLDAAGGGADQLVTRIYDQGREGACVANAFGQASEVIQALQHGRDRVVPLSAMSLYKRIGRSASSGAMVSDGIKEMLANGILPLDTPKNRELFAAVMANTGWSNPFPPNWKDTAKLFRVDEYQIARTTRGMLTALCKQFPAVIGRERHSICYLRPMRRNGRRVVKYANSWHERWGDRGFGYDTESQFNQSAKYAVIVRTKIIRYPAPRIPVA